MDAHTRKVYVPMTETGFYILFCLQKPNHGYGIVQMVENLTDGEIRLAPGTMYGSLSKMEKDGMVAEDEGRQKLYWSDGEYIFIMEINYDMSDKLLAEIFASIEQVESLAPYQNLVPAEDVEIRELPPISELKFPTEIPEGWEQTRQSENPISEYNSYWKFASETEQRSVIEFTQTTDEEYYDSVLFLWAASVKNYTEESKMIGDICYTVFVSENQIQIIWQQDGYFFSLDNAGMNLATLDDLLAMAQSVE